MSTLLPTHPHPREPLVQSLCLLDAAAAAAETLTWDNSTFPIAASDRITPIDRDVPSYFQSLKHLVRYCVRSPLALERLSVIHGSDGRNTRIRETGGHWGDSHGTGGCCDTTAKPRRHNKTVRGTGLSSATHGGGGRSPFAENTTGPKRTVRAFRF